MARKMILLASIGCFLATGAGIGLIASGITSSLFLYLATTIVGAIGLFLAFLVIVTTAAMSTFLLKRLRKERAHDAFLTHYNRTFRIFPIIGLVLTINCVLVLQSLWRHPGDPVHLILTIGGTVAAFSGIWTYALQLSPRFRTQELRRLIKDEFFQDNLSKSRSDGFYALLALLTVCFFAGLFSERLAVSLLPVAAGLSVAFAGWRFNRRDAKAADDE